MKVLNDDRHEETPASPSATPASEHPADGGRPTSGAFRVADRARSRLASMTQHARARLAEAGPEPDEFDGPWPVLELKDEDPTGRSVPGGIKEAASWCWRLLLIGVTIYVAVRVLAMVPVVTIPFIVALLLTAVLGPVKNWLHRKVGIPHSLAAFLALLLGVTVIGVVATFVGQQISANAPRMADRFAEFVDATSAWLRNGPLQVSDEQVQGYGEEITAAISRNQDRLLTGAISTLSALSHAIAGLLLLLLSTFFLLRDGDLIWRWVLSLLPYRSRARLDHVGRYGWHTLGGYVRGQTIIAALHACTVFVVLAVLHVPMAVALAVLIFIGSYIPLLGMTITGAFCIVVSLIEHGPVAAIVVAVTIIVLIQLEAQLLQPLIMARTVEVHPLGVATAVLAGTAIGNIAGALFAVPLVAFLNATIRASNRPLPETPDRPETPETPETPGPADAARTAPTATDRKPDAATDTRHEGPDRPAPSN